MILRNVHIIPHQTPHKLPYSVKLMQKICWTWVSIAWVTFNCNSCTSNGNSFPSYKLKTNSSLLQTLYFMGFLFKWMSFFLLNCRLQKGWQKPVSMPKHPYYANRLKKQYKCLLHQFIVMIHSRKITHHTEIQFIFQITLRWMRCNYLNPQTRILF